jgi:vesicle-fusing ATPase
VAILKHFLFTLNHQFIFFIKEMDYHSGANAGGYYDNRAAHKQNDGGITMNVRQCPSDAAALSNNVFVAPGQIHPENHYILVNDNFVFTVR